MSERRHLITVMGLGPGDVSLLTVEAMEVLREADRLYVRTEQHPTVTALQDRFPNLRIHSFDDLYAAFESFEDVYGRIVSRLLELAADIDVIYCVPGSPSVDETTVELLRSLAASRDIPLRVIQGLSYIEPALSAVQDYDASWLTVVDAVEIDLLSKENAMGEVQGKPGRLPIRLPIPTVPLLVSQMYSSHMAASVKLWLSRYWPEDHQVCVIQAAATTDQKVSKMPLYQLDRVEVDHLTSLFVPGIVPVDNVRTFAGLLEVTRTLRAPGGCPWDREQNHDTLKPYLVEEAYEVIDSLDKREYDKVAEELGDLLFQITIHSQIAAEQGEFDILDVISSITTKLIRRHPHVFGDVDLPTSSAVLERWESFKEAERPGQESVLSSIPEVMPALPYSYAIQKRAASQGFEWPDVESLLAKVDEELGELRDELAGDPAAAQLVEEIGDLFFVLVSVARRLNLDPEESLRRANRKFVNRFRYVESRSRQTNQRLPDLSPKELDQLWEEAKGSE